MADADAEEARVLKAKQLPFSQRLADKNWKIRRDAFDDIREACSGSASPDASYGDHWLKRTELV